MLGAFSVWVEQIYIVENFLADRNLNLMRLSNYGSDCLPFIQTLMHTRVVAALLAEAVAVIRRDGRDVRATCEVSGWLIHGEKCEGELCAGA